MKFDDAVGILDKIIRVERSRMAAVEPVAGAGKGKKGGKGKAKVQTEPAPIDASFESLQCDMKEVRVVRNVIKWCIRRPEPSAWGNGGKTVGKALLPSTTVLVERPQQRTH